MLTKLYLRHCQILIEFNLPKKSREEEVSKSHSTPERARGIPEGIQCTETVNTE